MVIRVGSIPNTTFTETVLLLENVPWKISLSKPSLLLSKTSSVQKGLSSSGAEEGMVVLFGYVDPDDEMFR